MLGLGSAYGARVAPEELVLNTSHVHGVARLVHTRGAPVPVEVGYRDGGGGGLKSRVSRWEDPSHPSSPLISLLIPAHLRGCRLWKGCNSTIVCSDRRMSASTKRRMIRLTSRHETRTLNRQLPLPPARKPYMHTWCARVCVTFTPIGWVSNHTKEIFAACQPVRGCA